MYAVAIESFVKGMILFALACAGAVALTHWAVRRKRLSPFGAWPRFVRRTSDPVVRPLERRILQAGGNPQDAPLWLLGLTVVGGLVLISLVRWLVGTAYRMAALSGAGPRGWLSLIVSWTFSILMAALIVRVIGSWFGLSRYSRLGRPVYLLTDWLVEPIRRLLPPFGMLDLSPLVAWIALLLMRGIVLGLLA